MVIIRGAGLASPLLVVMSAKVRREEAEEKRRRREERGGLVEALVYRIWYFTEFFIIQIDVLLKMCL